MGRTAKEQLAVCSRALLIMVLFITALSCATFTRDASRAGAIDKGAWTITLNAMGDLYKGGLISEEVKDRAIELGKHYKELHNIAMEMLARYLETKDEFDRGRYLESVVLAADALKELLRFCDQYLGVFGEKGE